MTVSTIDSAGACRPALVTASLSGRAGGMFYSARIPANLMRARGCDLTVYGLADDGWPEARADWHVDHITAYPTIGPKRLGVSPQLARDLAGGGHDLIHLRGLWSGLSQTVNHVRDKSRVPTIISPEGMLDPWALSNSRLKKRLALLFFERANLRHATVLHALNQTEAADMRAFGLRNPIAIVPNGVDLPAAGPPADRISPDGRRTLLFLGRIHPKKGIRELIDAWAAAIKISPALRSQWRVVIGGWDDGNTLDPLKKHVASLDLDASIVFAGALFGAEKEAALRNASAFILPSFGEGLPLSVLEAWAHSVPVLMTDQCNLPEGFEAGAAIRIETGPELATTLVRALIEEVDTLVDMGRRGRGLAEERFVWSSVAEQYLALYDWAAAGGAAPEFVQFE